MFFSNLDYDVISAAELIRNESNLLTEWGR